MKILRLTVLLTAILGVPGSAISAVAGSDLQIAARALSFMTNAPAGSIRVGIVFNSANPQSAADAGELQRLMAGGLRVGNMTMQPQLVPVADVAAAQVALFFLTEGVGSAGRLGEVTRAKRVPCITADLATVREGVCAIGIRSTPRIEILVNRAAAEASGVNFSTAFRMLITEF